jgi:hypothetical protein
METMQFIHSSNVRSIARVINDNKTVSLEAVIDKCNIVTVQACGDLRAHGFYRFISDNEEIDDLTEVLIVDAAVIKGIRYNTSPQALEEHITSLFPQLIRVDLEDPDGNLSIKFVVKELVINDWHDLAYGISDKTPVNQSRPEWLDHKIP